jgi:hypothetical protein
MASLRQRQTDSNEKDSTRAAKWMTVRCSASVPTCDSKDDFWWLIENPVRFNNTVRNRTRQIVMNLRAGQSRFTNSPNRRGATVTFSREQ